MPSRKRLHTAIRRSQLVLFGLLLFAAVAIFLGATALGEYVRQLIVLAAFLVGAEPLVAPDTTTLGSVGGTLLLTVGAFGVYLTATGQPALSHPAMAVAAVCGVLLLGVDRRDDDVN